MGDVGTPQTLCRFCDIVRRDIAALTVYEDDCAVAFLDRRPLFPGHVLLVPRLHAVTLADLPEELVGPLFTAARFMSRGIEEAMGAEGTFVAMNNRVSQSVPHLHVHIVPRRRGDGLKGFFWPRNGYASEAEAQDVQMRLKEWVKQKRKPIP